MWHPVCFWRLAFNCTAHLPGRRIMQFPEDLVRSMRCPGLKNHGRYPEIYEWAPKKSPPRVWPEREVVPSGSPGHLESLGNRKPAGTVLPQSVLFTGLQWGTYSNSLARWISSKCVAEGPVAASAFVQDNSLSKMEGHWALVCAFLPLLEDEVSAFVIRGSGSCQPATAGQTGLPPSDSSQNFLQPLPAIAGILVSVGQASTGQCPPACFGSQAVLCAGPRWGAAERKSMACLCSGGICMVLPELKAAERGASEGNTAEKEWGRGETSFVVCRTECFLKL